MLKQSRNELSTICNLEFFQCLHTETSNASGTLERLPCYQFLKKDNQSVLNEPRTSQAGTQFNAQKAQSLIIMLSIAFSETLINFRHQKMERRPLGSKIFFIFRPYSIWDTKIFKSKGFFFKICQAPNAFSN